MALLALAAACEKPAGSGASDAPSPTPPAPRYADALAAADAEVAATRAAAQADPASARAQETLARALLDRAWLNGAFEDYVDALASAGRAAERDPAACATAAHAALAAHRLDAARIQLARCEDTQHPAAPGLRADLALQEGRYANALALARAALAPREAPRDLARLAQVHAATGAPHEALGLLDRAEKLDHAGRPALRAWLALQRGLVHLQRGRWEEALAHYLAAERVLSGWWRVTAHLAEVQALLGDRPAAIQAYRAALAQQADPELMDALAALLRDAADPEAQDWIARAGAAHQARLARLPELAAHHALEHFLRFAPASTETLALARRNVAGRGGAAPRLALARVLLAAGQAAAARDEVEMLAAGGYDTAEVHAVAHDALARLGLPGEAARHAARAAAMNPRWRAQYPAPP